MTFRVWAPGASSVHVFGSFNGWNTNSIPLVKESPATNGVWSVDVPAARPGDQFKYSINNAFRRRDPRARQVVHSGEAGAVIYDTSAYRWNSREFLPPRPDELVLYEMHIGTYGGDFTGSAARLDYLVELGVNAVQLMPVAEFAGDNSWGYNPSDPFAVESSYGGPDGLKAFVDACHERGIAVLLDVVHNHYGPDDLQNSLWNFDGNNIYFYQDVVKAQTKWGPRPDFGRHQVRQYIKDNIRMWLDEYRIDGFRWDATQFIRFATNGTAIADGALLLREVADMMAREFPDKLHIAEDHVGDGLVTLGLGEPGGLGFDSEWKVDFHGILTSQLTNHVGRNPEVIADLLRFTNHLRRVHYVESHDEVGDHNLDMGARRFTTEIATNQPFGWTARKLSTLAATLMMTAPGLPMLFQGQEMLENELFSDMRPVDWNKTNSHAGIVRLYRDLVHLRTQRHGVSGGLLGPVSSVSVTNEGALLLMRRGTGFTPDDDVFVIANLSSNFVEGYWIDFPTNGTWYTHFNSDQTAYSTNFGGWGSAEVFAWPGDNRGNPYVAPWSVLVMSRYPPPPPDTDRDGMPDAWETAAGLNPLDPRDAVRNPDRDAYSNVQEYRAGTPPFVWNAPASSYAAISVPGDFNGWNPVSNTMARIADGLWQLDRTVTAATVHFKFAANGGWDINWGIVSQAVFNAPLTLAASNISDNIVLSNLAAGVYRFRFDEYSLRFTVRPVPVADSDLDGLPDEWERAYGLNPLSTIDAFGNPDNDLYDNQEEFRRGFHPTVWTPPLTDWSSMRVQGSFSAASPFMAQDPSNHYTWVLTTNLVQTTGLTFRIVANSDPVFRWAFNGSVGLNLPASGTLVYGGNFQVAVTQVLHGTYRFTFNEQTRAYSLATIDADQDGDGLPDWWEQQYFGNVTNAPPGGDPDGDGRANVQEYRGATHPQVYDQPGSNFAAMAVPGTFNGWNTAPNMTLVGPNLWRATVMMTNAVNPEFKFTANGNWTDNWGHNHQAGLPVNGVGVKNLGNNMRINGTITGRLVFHFNDATLAYSVAYDPTESVLDAGFAGAGPGGPLVIRWNSSSGMVYRLSRGTNLSGAFAVVASNLPATPPENAYTDAVINADAVFYRITVNP